MKQLGLNGFAFVLFVRTDKHIYVNFVFFSDQGDSVQEFILIKWLILLHTHLVGCKKANNAFVS